MDAWVQVYAKLLTHWKTCKLRDELALRGNYEAVGLIVSLWLWAAQNASDGNITNYSARDIADGIGYKKPAGKLMDALVKCKLIDKSEEGTRIHDWEEHAALLMDAASQQRENTRKRVQRHRERIKQRQQEERNEHPDEPCNGECNVTVTQGNAPSYPILSYPNLSSPILTNNSTGAAGDFARVRAATDSELASIGIKPGEYHGLTNDLVEAVRQTTVALFNEYKCGVPQLWDYRQVFRNFGAHGERAALLPYAFEKAAVSGKLGDWRYVDGIMDQLFARGIETVEQARRWDEERPDIYGEESL